MSIGQSISKSTRIVAYAALALSATLASAGGGVGTGGTGGESMSIFASLLAVFGLA